MDNTRTHTEELNREVHQFFTAVMGKEKGKRQLIDYYKNELSDSQNLKLRQFFIDLMTR